MTQLFLNLLLGDVLNTHLREKRVEAVDLLSFCHIGIVLGDALQGELLHQVDLVRLLQVFVLDKKFTVYREK